MIQHKYVYKKIGLFSPYKSNGGGKNIQCLLKETIIASNQYMSVVDIDFELKDLLNTLRKSKDIIKCDIVIIQSIFNMHGLLISFFCLYNNIKYIVLPRGDYVPNLKNSIRTKSRIKKWLLWFLLWKPIMLRAAAIVFTSNLEKKRFLSVNLKNNNIVVIEDPFDSTSPTNYPANFEIGAKEAVFLGRISHEKNLFFLIKIWKKINRLNTAAVLKIVGPISDHKLYDNLVRYIYNNNVNNIVFLPWVDDWDKNNLLLNSRCLLLPSFNESFGLVVPEAILSRTPCLVSNETPWSHLPKSAGCCLELNEDIWISHILKYLSSPKKLYVKPDDIIYILDPLTPKNISKKWSDLFEII